MIFRFRKQRCLKKKNAGSFCIHYLGVDRLWPLPTMVPNLAFNSFQSMQGLAPLTKLTRLNASHNQLTSLESIGGSTQPAGGTMTPQGHIQVQQIRTASLIVVVSLSLCSVLLCLGFRCCCCCSSKRNGDTDHVFLGAANSYSFQHSTCCGCNISDASCCGNCNTSSKTITGVTPCAVGLYVFRGSESKACSCRRSIGRTSS